MSAGVTQSRELRSANRRLALKLAVAVVGMFGFGYALVPLYDVLCEITGLNGKTGRLDAETAAAATVDESRLVTVEFVANTNGLPWSFYPVTNKVRVHPGEVIEVDFIAENKAPSPITGQAVPSVSPNEGARYFSKTECFCFTQQTLGPNESKTMPVRFIVSSNLPKQVSTITLSYTFFQSPGGNAAAAPAPSAGAVDGPS